MAVTDLKEAARNFANVRTLCAATATSGREKKTMDPKEQEHRLIKMSDGRFLWFNPESMYHRLHEKLVGTALTDTEYRNFADFGSMSL